MSTVFSVLRARWALVPAALAAALCAFAAIVATAAPAFAHATLLGTDPPHDALLETAPEQVTLTFDEPVSVWDTSVTVFDPDGERLDVDARAVDSTVVAALPTGLAEGSYTVNYRVISADDHPVSGGFTFSIGVRTTPTVPVAGDDASAALNVARLIADGLGYAGLLGAVGLGAFELFVLDATPGAMPVLRRRLRRARWTLSIAAVVGFAFSPALTTSWQQAGSLGDVLSGAVWFDAVASHAAVSALLAVFGLAAANTLATRGGRGSGPRQARWLAMGAGVVALAALPWVGHTRVYGPQWLVVAADFVHVAAASFWIGCVLGLVLTLWRGSDASPARAASTTARFSGWAAWMVVLLAVAGTTLAWRVMGSVDTLWESSYGRALLVKLLVVGWLLVAAGYNRMVLLPAVLREPRLDAGRRALRRSLGVEAAGLVAVLAVTSVLVTQPPGAGDTDPGDAGISRGIEEPLGEGLARVRLSPVVPGRNVVQLYLRDADGDPMRVIGVPSVRFTQEAEDIGPVSVELERVGPGQFEGTVDLAVAGAWDVDVSARTSRYEAPIATMTFEVG